MPKLRPRQFDLIAFDWDGTLYDSTALIVRCIQSAVVDVGGARPSDYDAAWVIGLGLAEALARAAPDVPPEKYPELGARYRHHFIRHQDDIVLFDGVLPMLDALRARGVTKAKLGAQTHAIGFYEKLGFTVHGPEYDDAGIPHRDMSRSL